MLYYLYYSLSGDVMRYTRKQFYLDFYKNHLLRDFLFVKMNPNVKYDTDSPYLPYDANLDYNRNIRNFLIKYSNPQHKFHGALFSQLTYYKTIGDLRIKDESERYSNCLFFDFDADADELHDLKTEIKKAYGDYSGRELFKKIAAIQKQYQKLLFTTDILEKPFADAKKLYDYFKSNNINCYTVFSGSKGIHLYVFYDECKLLNYSEISYKLAESYKSALDLPTLDLAVNKDAIARKSRVIYSKHETSNLFATPFDIETDSIDDVLSAAKKQKVTPFDLSNYTIADKSFVATLKKIDDDVTAKNEIIVAEKKKWNKAVNGAAISDAEKDEIFSDMRVLLKVIVGEPVKEFKNYNSYNCPFHDDNSPSARVYKNNFLCATENLHLNYFDFIRKYYDLADDDAVKDKMKELKKLVMQQNQ